MRLLGPIGRPLLLSATSLSFLLAAGAADAAPPNPSPAPGPARSSTQFTLRREEAGGGDAQTARARARAGDCAGALPAFDAAIKATIEPTLRRDRGLCHENLGQPYPAIDDYRAYLTARPEAPDAEQIQQRLSALEEQVGASGPSSATKERERDSNGEVRGAASVTVGSGGVEGHASSSKSSSRSSVLGPKPGEQERSYDYYSDQEKLADAAEASPLRNGSGLIVGAFGYVPRFWFGSGVSNDLAFAAGGTLRYSTGPVVTLVSEVGYAGIGTEGELSALSGPMLMGGVEARLPVTRYASDQILLRGGLGFEHYTVQGTRASLNFWAGRFALGYRHVFGPVLGFEILADGGPALLDPEGDGESRFVGFFGGQFALVVGF